MTTIAPTLRHVQRGCGGGVANGSPSEPYPGRTWLGAFAVFVAIVLALVDAEAGQVYSDTPPQIDPKGHYLIFLQGPVAGEPVAQGFARRGFDVVTERRPPAADPLDAARKAMAQVRRLLEGGVPGSRIAVAGYDQGGTSAMIAAALLKDPSISYVVLAGCGLDDRYQRFAAQLADQMAGRMLHLWEKTDPQAESCQLAFSRAPQLDSDEKLLSHDRGPEVFWDAAPLWMDLVQGFLHRR
jgi:hypothetical protein